jgi:hypothetical protein
VKPPIHFAVDLERNWSWNIVKHQDLKGNLISRRRGNNKPNHPSPQKIANIYIENVSGNITLYTQWHKSCLYLLF